MSQAQAVRQVRCEYVGKRCVTLTLWRERGAEWFGVEVDGSAVWSSADASDSERRWARPYFDGLVEGLKTADDERALAGVEVIAVDAEAPSLLDDIDRARTAWQARNPVTVAVEIAPREACCEEHERGAAEPDDQCTGKP